ncbi:MAG: Apolipoprotein N-acyltransferase-like protein [Pedosphaera sp.]|nr:Apolipoprotein N-acyltransferase-like protein [Pedosphaera sp.]
MNITTTQSSPVRLPFKHALGLILAGAVAFQAAYTFAPCSFLIVIYLWCLFQLALLGSSRQAFYSGLMIGVLAYAPQSTFLWTIFGPAAIPLWFVLSFWIGVFLLLARLCLTHLGKLPALLLIPCLWTGLEYFRSELYYLRFSWFNAGFVFSGNLQWLPFRLLGVYGIGFLLMAIISLSTLLKRKQKIVASAALLALLGLLTNAPIKTGASSSRPGRSFQAAGVQLEFPSETQVIVSLNELIKTYPQAKLLLLSEYTVDGPVPPQIQLWCKKNQRYLIVGAKVPASAAQYFDTGFVIDPAGEIVFRQGKSVPIQFFKDGLPAREQKLWDSPWGKIGICICYDLSYSRVTDRLVRLGAQAIIVPTMDLVDWGRHQHELHARVAPIRSAEYGVPIFRLASSGISQCVDKMGIVSATAPVPGDGAMIAGTVVLERPGTLPLDRVIAPASCVLTGLFIAWLTLRPVLKGRRPQVATSSTYT